MITIGKLLKDTIFLIIVTIQYWLIYVLGALIFYTALTFIPIININSYFSSVIEIIIILPLVVAAMIISLQKRGVLAVQDYKQLSRKRFPVLCLWSLLQNTIMWIIAYIPYYVISFLSGWSNMIKEMPLPIQKGELLQSLLFTKDFSILQYLATIGVFLLFIIPGIIILLKIAFIDLAVFQEGKINAIKRSFQLTSKMFGKLSLRLLVIYIIGFGIPFIGGQLLTPEIPSSQLWMGLFTIISVLWNTTGVSVVYANLKDEQ
jgi:hypothetical protein